MIISESKLTDATPPQPNHHGLTTLAHGRQVNHGGGFLVTGASGYHSGKFVLDQVTNLQRIIEWF